MGHHAHTTLLVIVTCKTCKQVLLVSALEYKYIMYPGMEWKLVFDIPELVLRTVIVH